MKWNYEYRNSSGRNTSLYRQHLSLYSHYGYKGRYFADLNIVASPLTVWLQPKDGLCHQRSQPHGDFLKKTLKDNKYINFLKLRASFGVINTDNIPGDGYWLQTYKSNGTYSFAETYTKLDDGGWTMGQLASLNSVHEKALKYNFGLDASLFNSLDVTFDTYYQRRKDIWVDGDGQYSSV